VTFKGATQIQGPATAINTGCRPGVLSGYWLTTHHASGPDKVYLWCIPGIYQVHIICRPSTFEISVYSLQIYSSCILLFAGIMSSAQTGPADPICTRKILFLKCYGNILVHLVYILLKKYIPGIYQVIYFSKRYIPGIYLVYTMVYDHLVITLDIPRKNFMGLFRTSHVPF
jgi:hypothetical protein